MKHESDIEWLNASRDKSSQGLGELIAVPQFMADSGAPQTQLNKKGNYEYANQQTHFVAQF